MAKEGKWQGKRLINETYWKKAVTPVEGNTAYGYLFWLNHPGKWSGSAGVKGDGFPIPGAPKNTVYAKGFQGQIVIALPTEKMVLARMGGDLKADSMPSVHRMWEHFAPIVEKLSGKALGSNQP